MSGSKITRKITAADIEITDEVLVAGEDTHREIVAASDVTTGKDVAASKTVKRVANGQSDKGTAAVGGT